MRMGRIALLPLLVSAHDERTHVEPQLYQSAQHHLLDLHVVVQCEEGPERMKRLEANLERMSTLHEP